jgi:IclR family acetate operon transcriptional repressor
VSTISTIESPSGASGNGQGGTQAVDRAAALLTHVIEADVAVTFAELSEVSGLARSTTSRLLAALERTRLVERVGTGEYIGGPLFALYAARHDRNAELARLAHPRLEDIGAETGESAHLAVATGGRVSHIAQVDSTYLLGARDWTDVEVPAHCSALGKVLLAWNAIDLPEEPLERVTERTLRAG